jgi:hypothetical protein
MGIVGAVWNGIAVSCTSSGYFFMGGADFHRQSSVNAGCL